MQNAELQRQRQRQLESTRTRHAREAPLRHHQLPRVHEDLSIPEDPILAPNPSNRWRDQALYLEGGVGSEADSFTGPPPDQPLSFQALSTLRMRHTVSCEQVPEGVDCAICLCALRHAAPGPDAGAAQQSGGAEDPSSSLELSADETRPRPVPRSQQLIVRLPCGGDHLFHWSCIRGWMGKCRLCPVCRQEVLVHRHAPFTSSFRAMSTCSLDAANQQRIGC